MPAHGSTASGSSLLHDRAQLEIELSAAFVDAAWAGGEVRPIEWDDAGTVLAAAIHPVAHEFNIISNLPTSAAAIGSYLGADGGSRRQLALKAHGTMSDSNAPDAPLGFYLGASVGEMLVGAGTHRWVVSWSSPVTVASIDGGDVIDIWGIAAAAARGDVEAEATISQLLATAHQRPLDAGNRQEVTHG